MSTIIGIRLPPLLIKMIKMIIMKSLPATMLLEISLEKLVNVTTNVTSTNKKDKNERKIWRF